MIIFYENLKKNFKNINKNKVKRIWSLNDISEMYGTSQRAQASCYYEFQTFTHISVKPSVFSLAFFSSMSSA